MTFQWQKDPWWRQSISISYTPFSKRIASHPLCCHAWTYIQMCCQRCIKHLTNVNPNITNATSGGSIFIFVSILRMSYHIDTQQNFIQRHGAITSVCGGTRLLTKYHNVIFLYNIKLQYLCSMASGRMKTLSKKLVAERIAHARAHLNKTAVLESWKVLSSYYTSTYS